MPAVLDIDAAITALQAADATKAAKIHTLIEQIRIVTDPDNMATLRAEAVEAAASDFYDAIIEGLNRTPSAAPVSLRLPTATIGVPYDATLDLIFDNQLIVSHPEFVITNGLVFGFDAGPLPDGLIVEFLESDNKWHVTGTPTTGAVDLFVGLSGFKGTVDDGFVEGTAMFSLNVLITVLPQQLLNGLTLCDDAVATGDGEINGTEMHVPDSTGAEYLLAVSLATVSATPNVAWVVEARPVFGTGSWTTIANSPDLGTGDSGPSYTHITSTDLVASDGGVRVRYTCSGALANGRFSAALVNVQDET